MQTLQPTTSALRSKEHGLRSLSSSISSLPGAPLSPNSSTVLLPRDLYNASDSAQALYSRAARAFLQRSHASALLTSQAALDLLNEGTESPRDAELTQVLERLLILRLTIFATLYEPRNPSGAPILEALKRQSSQASQQLQHRLGLPVEDFLLELWKEPLKAYHPDLISHWSELDSLDPSPSTLRSPLDLPGGLVAAAIMSALRVDGAHTDSEPSANFNRVVSRKEMASTNAASLSGLKAARSICEWVLAAHSAPLLGHEQSAMSVKALQARQEQYDRVLELYTLHVLGARAGEWDYAEQLISLSGGGDSQSKEALLHRLYAAKDHIASRPERRRIASEAATRAYEAEKARRASESKAVAATGATAAIASMPSSASASSSRARSERAAGEGEGKRRVRRLSSSSGASARSSAAEADVERPSERRPQPQRSASSQDGASRAEQKAVAKPTSSSDFAARRSSVRDYLARGHERDSTLDRSRSLSSSQSTNARSGILQLFNRFAQMLKTHPMAAVRWVGVILVALSILRNAAAYATSLRGVGRLGTARRIAGSTTEPQSGGGGNSRPGLVRLAAAKLWDTMRMGTQVTYL
ncbi:hypothetical protein IE81DRAFT_319215 [Ceraceosorus guamensis]|uniref:Uncharacterized protein n=1 Tax=Ceraceosorus guamensis TaxID=1522189 RepID=A0A316W8W5_9BASI|nr:hypothetical protein IE81DRAFT_319215 [Ceraceosorus guamensis]PWN46319.1 hypothetical protein IE81DRAFT_319215 [Ceraceosorus guamensis]